MVVVYSHRAGRLLTGMILCLAMLGCRGGDGYDRYVPPIPAARAALDTALHAWQDGAPPGRIDTVSPVVQVVDSHRPAGQKLLSFEILGEVKGEGPRSFVVRLSLDPPRQEVKRRYCVLGINPLWVLPEEEYEMLTHWECFALPATESGTAKVSAKGKNPQP
jgi:hypothetical protein